MNRTTRIAHLASVALMAAGVLAATGVGFAQSWAGLYGWAIEHGLNDWKAMSFPAMVDVFIGVGELGLFALTLEGHRLRKSALSWADLFLPGAIATTGWGVSLAFNVGHVDHELSDQLTAAVPPVASMLGLLVLLRTLHRLVTRAPVATTGLDAELAAPDGGAATVVASPSWWPLPDLGSAGQAADGYALWDEIEPSRETLPPALPEAPDDEPEQCEEPPVEPDLVPVVATARDRYAEVLATGALPSVRQLRRELRIGHPKARLVREALAVEGAP
ncbi:DUF2637 domain-containing protein [Actinomadura sp. WMMA1423]|uniref:DUF2637 domain-containing protein n=1 Tax=Actinomadura sp. WMMA1423 TaxID=2591108 RepID=UPI00114706C3|nr:DUF2637 domain-containing protein [Actinomadura sp. WMMA1423]